MMEKLRWQMDNNKSLFSNRSSFFFFIVISIEVSAKNLSRTPSPRLQDSNKTLLFPY